MTADLALLGLADLQRAWRRVRRHPTPGLDRVRITDVQPQVDSWLEARRREILHGTWRPGPLLRITKRKPTGGTRTLRLPTLADRVVLAAVHDAVAPTFDRSLDPRVHGYRAGRSPRTAVAHLLRQAGSRPWVELVHADIASMFDTLPHALLRPLAALGCVRWRTIVDRLLLRWATAPRRGVPQGAALSPLLANLALARSLDVHLARAVTDGHLAGWIRYGDDLVLLTDRPGGATSVLIALDGWVRRCGLRLAAHKTTVARPRSVLLGQTTVLGVPLGMTTDNGGVRLLAAVDSPR